MIRVLHFIPALDGGGIERLVYNYYQHMNHEEVHFDFAIHAKEKGILGEEFSAMGSEIYFVTPKKEGFFKYLSEVWKILHRGNYDVVHTHQGLMSFFPVFLAWLCGVKSRISHSHNAVFNESLPKRIVKQIFRALIFIFSTDYFACGRDAAVWLYGSSAVKDNKVRIIKNAIDLSLYRFNDEVRTRHRDGFGLGNKFCIGHVGRFIEQKNHDFLIDIFAEIHKQNQDTVLLLIGTGGLFDRIVAKTEQLGLQDSVIFTGVRTDVNELYQAMDLFLLPSLHEGLPFVVIEAQAAGLPCVLSDAITDEPKITEYVEYVSLKEKPESWAREILDIKEKNIRYDSINEITVHGYSVDIEALKLEMFYKSI